MTRSRGKNVAQDIREHLQNIGEGWLSLSEIALSHDLTHEQARKKMHYLTSTTGEVNWRAVGDGEREYQWVGTSSHVGVATVLHEQVDGYLDDITPADEPPLQFQVIGNLIDFEDDSFKGTIVKALSPGWPLDTAYLITEL